MIKLHWSKPELRSETGFYALINMTVSVFDKCLGEQMINYMVRNREKS